MSYPKPLKGKKSFLYSSIMAKNKKIGNRIIQARQDIGLTVDDLAARLNLELGTVKFIESGQRRTDEQLLEKIAEITVKPLKYFYTGVYPGHDRPMYKYPKHP